LIFLVVLCFIFTLTACKQPSVPSDTQSDETSSSADTNDTSSNNDESNDTSSNNDEANDTLDETNDAASSKDETADTSSNEEKTDDLYPYPEIPEDKIAIEGSKKVFNDSWITFSLPIDWICMVQGRPDGSLFHFQEPNLGENCKITMSITGSEYLYDRTKDEYLKYVSNIHKSDNLKLDYYKKETLKGYRCIKAVYSYTADNTEFTRIHYDNVVANFRMYDFYITYPASESNTYKAVFESIIDSVKFIPK